MFVGKMIKLRCWGWSKREAFKVKGFTDIWQYKNVQSEALNDGRCLQRPLLKGIT